MATFDGGPCNGREEKPLPSGPNYFFGTWIESSSIAGTCEIGPCGASGMASVTSVPQFDSSASRWTLTAAGSQSGSSDGACFGGGEVREEWSMLISSDCAMKYTVQIAFSRSGPEVSGRFGFYGFGLQVESWRNPANTLDTLLVGDLPAGVQTLSYASDASRGAGNFTITVTIESAEAAPFRRITSTPGADGRDQ